MSDLGARPLWHGRLGNGPADTLVAFTDSLAIDRRLAPDDVAGSRAHVRMLHAAGLLDADETSRVLAALDGRMDVLVARLELERVAGELGLDGVERDENA